MVKIIRLEAVSSIKVGRGSTVLEDGTIQDPVPYEAVNVAFDDGVTVQVEQPLTRAAVKAAYAAAVQEGAATIDEVSVGDVIEAVGPEPVEGPA